MATLTDARIAELLEPFLASPTPEVVRKMSQYLDLLLKWNARTNLTAIRDPEEVVQRHFGESLFAARHLAEYVPANAAVMDFGSGAGFPGLPMQILCSGFRVTLAESQNKKAAFLQEAVRTLGARAEVWSKRVEDMPATRRFDAVALRAVDNMPLALTESVARVAQGGWLAVLAGDPQLLTADHVLQLPASENRYVLLQKAV